VDSIHPRSAIQASPAAPPIRLAGSLLEERRHACAFFNSREEEYSVSLPFIKNGFECGHRAFHLVGSERRQDHLQRLEGAGVDTVATRRTGQFELKDWQETYLEGGYFDPDRWLGVLEEVLAEGPRQGYPLTRVVAHMEWALEDRVGVERLIEYEARINHMWPLYKDAVICTYDLGRFGAKAVIDVIRTHPLVIIGSVLQQNPFYVPPDQFLEELRERGTAAGWTDSAA
jgi:DcmR-like sensory protein